MIPAHRRPGAGSGRGRGPSASGRAAAKLRKNAGPLRQRRHDRLQGAVAVDVAASQAAPTWAVPQTIFEREISQTGRPSPAKSWLRSGRHPVPATRSPGCRRSRTLIRPLTMARSRRRRGRNRRRPVPNPVPRSADWRVRTVRSGHGTCRPAPAATRVDLVGQVGDEQVEQAVAVHVAQRNPHVPRDLAEAIEGDAARPGLRRRTCRRAG